MNLQHHELPTLSNFLIYFCRKKFYAIAEGKSTYCKKLIHTFNTPKQDLNLMQKKEK